MIKECKGENMLKKNSLAQRVGKKLKILIKNSKWKTQKSFSNEIGVHPATIRRWINKGINDLNTIALIVSVMNIELEDLLK